MIPLHYIALAVALAFVGGYVTGCSEEKEKFDSFKQVTKALGEAQEARTKRWIAEGKQNVAEANAKHVQMVADLKREHDAALRRMRARTASTSIVPATRPTPEGRAGLVCFDQNELAVGVGASMERLLARASAIVHKGNQGLVDFAVCAENALKNANRQHP